MNFLINSHIIDYEYINSGSNKTVLFLHGWGGNKDSFVKVKRILQSRFNILTVTLPTCANTTISLTMYDYKNIMLNLLTLLGAHRIIIICHSFGFRVSLMLATTKINIEKIIITGGAGIKPNVKSFIKLTRRFNSIFLRKHPECFDKYASSDYKTLSLTNRKTFKNIINKDLTDYIKLLHCPILLFWGSKDTATPIKMFKIIKKLQPTSHYKIITNGTHFCYLEHSELFVDACEKFLNNA